MLIYQGEFLQITYERENSLFVQYWTKSPKSTTDFKSEMLTYIAFFKKYKPKLVLWLQENFTLDIDTDTKFWIEEHINKIGHAISNEKIAFVVSKDILAHLEVINTFEETKSVLTPKHFASENEARNWLLRKEEIITPNKKSKIIFDGVDETGNPIFKFNSKSNDITDTIKFFNSYLERDKIIEEYQDKFEKLTNRETELLSLFSKGKKLVNIADELSISIHTARTHWKNIKNKLDLKENSQILQIANTFLT